MPLLKRLSAVAIAAVCAVTALATSVSADEPYEGYNYDYWLDTIPSQNGFVVDTVYSGKDMDLELDLNAPSDMYVYEETGDLYIVDTANNRIVIVGSDFKVKRIMDTFTYAADYTPKKSGDTAGGTTTLNKPSGIFVLNDRGRLLIYICDHDNERVLACYEDGTIWMEYTKPSSDLYDAQLTFNPEKVVVDGAKNVYVCITSITQGAVEFAEDGSFSGYYGANRVEQTAEVIANAFWKLIYSREQILRMRRSVAVEFSNFDIDSDGFIYTVTELKSANTDILKKLNPAGKNIFTSLGYDEYTFGDFASIYYNGKTYKSSITDVEVDKNGNIILLDFTAGRVFQYTDECDLLFIFGGIGNQKGTFTSPTSVESYNGKIYVLDERKNNITVFKQTEFGGLVHNAIALLNEGLWVEGLEPWQDVLKADSNYYYAYIGIGNAYLNSGEFGLAMDYFYHNARGGYNRAFKDFRIQFIRQYFNVFAVIVIVIVIGLIALNFWLKSRKRKRAMMGGGNG